MDQILAAEQVAETGRLMLESGLVARTWGNFSARLDETHFCITPSGLGYEHMTAGDTVICCLTDDSRTGTRKPSSEKGIHAEAYRLFPEAGFVIHTHQTYATALGLTGPDSLKLSPEETERLGGVAWAEYGLPGTKKLKAAVARAMEQGAGTVLMAHHGTLICGRDRADALGRAELLEDICRRNCLGQEATAAPQPAEALLRRAQSLYPTAALENSAPVLSWAALRRPIMAQLDDMAQMIGCRIPAAKDAEEALRLLEKHDAVLLPGVGALVRGDDREDTEALKALTRKAAVSALHCRALGRDAQLNLTDCLLMRRIYLMKYSKKKRG